jgi:hypothetical protein
VFNLDDMDTSKWDDRKPKIVVVPAEMVDQPIHHRASRTLNHVSLIACLSAAGESFVPSIVPLQDSHSLHEDLRKRGV